MPATGSPASSPFFFSSIVAVAFSVIPLSDMFETNRVHQIAGPASPWYDEYLSYQWLFMPTADAHILAIGVGRHPLADHVFAETRTVIDAEDRADRAGRGANGAADDCPDCRPFAAAGDGADDRAEPGTDAAAFVDYLMRGGVPASPIPRRLGPAPSSSPAISPRSGHSPSTPAVRSWSAATPVPTRRC